MAIGTHHLHVKTRDPKQTMQFYVDNLGATLIAEVGTRGYRVNLHGLTLNITTIIDTQRREQHYGLEHIALDTDDYPGTLARLRANGVRILDELPPTSGRPSSWAASYLARIEVVNAPVSLTAPDAESGDGGGAGHLHSSPSRISTLLSIVQR